MCPVIAIKVNDERKCEKVIEIFLNPLYNI